MLRPERITAARELLSVTQADLAATAGVTQAMISMVEKHRRDFTPALADAFAGGLGLPVEFFAVPSAGVPRDEVHFRKNATARVKDTTRTFRFFDEGFRVTEQLLDGSGYPRPLIPVVQDDAPVLSAERIGQIADETRRALALSVEEPITNVTRALERSGIAVAPIGFTDEALPGHDGLAHTNGRGNATLIGYVSKSGDRDRFTIAHELGHLVLHSYRHSDDREREAHQFAGAFLLPDAHARELIEPDTTLGTLARVKASWGISIAALVKRGEAVGVLSKDRTSTLFRQIASRGWRTQEPVEVRPETPRLLFRLLQAKYGETPYSNRAIEHDLALPLLFLRALAPAPTTGRDLRPVVTLRAR